MERCGVFRRSIVRLIDKRQLLCCVAQVIRRFEQSGEGAVGLIDRTLRTGCLLHKVGRFEGEHTEAQLFAQHGQVLGWSAGGEGGCELSG